MGVTSQFSAMMGCCCSRPESMEDDRTNAHVNLLQVTETEAGESETDQLGSCEGGLPGADESLHVQKVEQQLSREEMTESARDHSDSMNTNPASDSEADKESVLTMSVVSKKDERYWKYEFKGP